MPGNKASQGARGWIEWLAMVHLFHFSGRYIDQELQQLKERLEKAARDEKARLEVSAKLQVFVACSDKGDSI